MTENLSIQEVVDIGQRQRQHIYQQRQRIDEISQSISSYKLKFFSESDENDLLDWEKVEILRLRETRRKYKRQRKLNAALKHQMQMSLAFLEYRHREKLSLTYHEQKESQHLYLLTNAIPLLLGSDCVNAMRALRLARQQYPRYASAYESLFQCYVLRHQLQSIYIQLLTTSEKQSQSSAPPAVQNHQRQQQTQASSRVALCTHHQDNPISIPIMTQSSSSDTSSSSSYYQDAHEISILSIQNKLTTAAGGGGSIDNKSEDEATEEIMSNQQQLASISLFSPPVAKRPIPFFSIDSSFKMSSGNVMNSTPLGSLNMATAAGGGGGGASQNHLVALGPKVFRRVTPGIKYASFNTIKETYFNINRQQELEKKYRCQAADMTINIDLPSPSVSVNDEIKDFLHTPQDSGLSSLLESNQGSSSTTQSSSGSSYMHEIPAVLTSSIEDVDKVVVGGGDFSNSFTSSLQLSTSAATVVQIRRTNTITPTIIQEPKTTFPVEEIHVNKFKQKSTNIKKSVRFTPLTILLDACLEGDLELVKCMTLELTDVSEPNEDGITALHNAICAGHDHISIFLVTQCAANVNCQEVDGWTPLHCAASCQNVAMCRLLVEHGAALFLRTNGDYETALDKCVQQPKGKSTPAADSDVEDDRDSLNGSYDFGPMNSACEDYLLEQQMNLLDANREKIYAAFDYSPQRDDELNLIKNCELQLIHSNIVDEPHWCLVRSLTTNQTGLVPQSFLSLSPLIVARTWRTAVVVVDSSQ